MCCWHIWLDDQNMSTLPNIYPTEVCARYLITINCQSIFLYGCGIGIVDNNDDTIEIRARTMWNFTNKMYSIC